MTAQVISFPDRYCPEPGPGLPQLDWESHLFIDWLTIRQNHPAGGLPIVFSGVATHTDVDGQLEFETLKRLECEGSYDSTMYLRCDGNAVEFHGNIARWERPDNVFGYPWDETLRRVNRLLRRFQLPPFSTGTRERYHDTGLVWIDGARISRIDITVNYMTGSAIDAERLIHLLGQHHRGRQRGGVTPDGATVIFGEGSKYVYGKCYLKYVELANHRRTKHGRHVDQELIDWCKDIGMVREEIELKSRFLTQTNYCWLGEITHQELMRIYYARSQLKRLKELQVKDTSLLSIRARGTLARYEQGEPHGLTRSAYYRHRKEILAVCGIDISVPRNITRVQLPTRVIEIQALVAPDWYRQKFG